MAAPNKSRPAATDESPLWSRRRRAILVTAIAVVAAVVIAGLITVAYLTGPGAKSGADSAIPPSSATPKPKPIAIPTSAPLAQPAAIQPGLTAQITKFEAVQGVATTPGSVSAPSVRITVTITNNTSKSVPLDTATITSYYGPAATPALQLYSPGGVDLPASVAAGKTASGVYLFSIPVADRSDVRFELDYSVNVKPLFFEGSIPG